MDISQPITDRRKAAAFPIEAVRARFPALAAPDDFIFLDNAAGAQVPAERARRGDAAISSTTTSSAAGATAAASTVDRVDRRRARPAWRCCSTPQTRPRSASA